MSMPLARLLRAAVAAAALTLVAAGAHAQFADETQDLFITDPEEPRTKDDIVIFEFSTAPEEGEEGVDTSAAQTVEDLCCSMTEQERATNALCVDLVCPQEAEQ